MITRATLSSVNQGLPKYRSMLAGNTAYSPAAYESIASYTAPAAASVTFSAIPQTYKHLQIRFNVSQPATGGSLYVQFNGDTGSNYARHNLFASSSAQYRSSSATSTVIQLAGIGSGLYYYNNAGVCDLYDYTNTSKTKTIRTYAGTIWETASNCIELNSGVWNNTSAITLITVSATFTLTTTSVISLYGVK